MLEAHSSNDAEEERLNAIETNDNSSNQDDLDLICAKEVILDPRTLLKEQIKQRRNMLSYGESLDSDLFKFFDDLEGNSVIKMSSVEN